MASSEAQYDVLVLGAGIFGTALGYRLAHRHGIRVGVIDQSSVGGGATRQGAGILTYQGWGPWDLELISESAAEYRALTESRGHGGFRVTGGIRIARSDVGSAWLDRVREVLESGPVAARILTAAQLPSLIPWGAFDDVVRALHTPDDATFSPLEVSQEYARLAEREGARVVVGTGPVALSGRESDWSLQSAVGTWRAPSLVVAAGPQSKRLLRNVGVRLPLAPFRTQAMRLRPRPLAGDFPTLHDLDLGLYARPELPGRVVVGDGTERQEADPGEWRSRADDEFIEGSLREFREIAPAWTRIAPEIGWAGLCVASPDRYPVVGKVPGHSGLFVATGFNGFGAMRAAALARRLADAIVEGVWEPLSPADPGRFTPDPAPFDPRPEFPLEALATGGAVAEADHRVGRPPTPSAEFDAPISYRSINTPDAVERLTLPSLSDWFDPLLPLFLTDALRARGRVELAELDDDIVGVYLRSPVEDVGSVFTRVRPVAEHYLDHPGRGGIYAEPAWVGGGEPIEILGADLRDWELEHPIRNPVRLALAEDLHEVRAFMRTIAGDVDEAWMRSLPRTNELCFLCRIDGRIAGVSWASVVGSYARGHSFMVHPRYRGLAVGTDLLQARMLWLRDAGVRQVVSEIYEGNRGSQTAAERAGMAVVGRMYHYRESGSAAG